MPSRDVVLAAGARAHRTVELVAGDRCGRFTATVISGIAVGPSPEWMARRLIAVGMRPINNVVDVCNYVMLERNQPNHAYDLDALGGGGFRVRLASDGETITTLDEVERTLTAADLMICDADDMPIGVGGVMGDRDSEITERTTTIALEIAWFEPDGIQHSAARLGLRTEASARFERGVDPYGIDASIARFVELLSITSPELVVHAGAADAARRLVATGRADAPAVRPARVNALLGTTISAERMIELLDPIGYTATLTDDATLEVVLPSWRPDSTAEVDVIEEIARHFGYEQHRQDRAQSTVHGRLSVRQARRRQLRQVLARPGVQRGDAQPVPRSRRPARRRSARRVGAHRQPAGRRGERAAHVAAPGPAQGGGAQRVAPPHRGRRCTRSATSTRRALGALPDEHEALGVVLAGADATAAMALWREIAAAMGFGARVDQGTVPAGLHPTRSATLSVGRDVVGALGEVHPDVCDAYDVERARRRARAEPRRAAGRRAEGAGVEGRPAATRRATSTSRSPPRRR